MKIIIIGFIIMLAGCKPPSKSEVQGCYVGHFGDAVETLVLNGDGSYSQHLERGGQTLYRNVGKWEQRSDGENLSMSDFMIAVDLSNAQMIKEAHLLTLSPTKFSIVKLGYYKTDGKSLLVGAPKTFYFFEKTDQNGPGLNNSGR